MNYRPTFGIRNLVLENCDAAELKFINPGPTRYGRDVATSLRAAVNKREQQLYREYLTQLRLKDRKYFHAPAGTVGPLERGLIKATNSGRTSRDG